MRKMSEARRASLQEIDQLHSEIMDLCSEDEDSIIENMGSDGRNNNSSVIFVGLSRASPQVIEIEDSLINLISDASVSLDSSGKVTSSPKQATRGQASSEDIHKTSLEKPYSTEEVFGKETVADLGSSSTYISQTNPSTLTSSMSVVSSDACKLKESFKNNGTCMVGKCGGNSDGFVVASSTTDNNASPCSRINIHKEYSSSAFTTMTVSKVASDKNVCSFDGGKDVEKVVVTEPMILSGNTPTALTKFRNENLSISSLDCSPIPRSDWRKIDVSNFTPIPGINNAVSACKVVHSTPLGEHKKFQNSSTVARRSIVPKTIEELCRDLSSDIGDHTLECKHDNKNTSSQCISGFAALCKGGQCQKPHQTFLGETIKSNAPLSKINLQSLVEENTTIINKKEDEKCGERNKEVCSSPVMGRFKDVSVSRSMSVLEEDILDVSEDILGLEENVITDNEIIDEEMETALLGLDTVQYAQLSQVGDKTLTKRDHLEDSMDEEMDKTLLEDTVQEDETVVSQGKNYDMNKTRKSLFPLLNTELVRFTNRGELDKQANVTTCNKTEETEFSDNKKDLAVESRKRSSQTFLFTELESGELVSGIDNCEFDQETVLATSDNGVFDQTTSLEKSDKIEYDQTTLTEKPQVSTSISSDDENDIYNTLNSSIDSFELIRSHVIAKEKRHTFILSKKDNRKVECQRKSVAEETLTSKICTAKPKAEASCTASTKPEAPTVLISEMLIKLRHKRRKRKLEKIMSSGEVLMRDIDPIESKENKLKKIETKSISEEMKVTKKKKTKVPLEERSEAVSNILLIAAEIMLDQGKVETNSQPEEPKKSMNNKDGKHADQKIKNRDVVHLNEGVKQQQIGSSSKVFLNIDVHSSCRNSEVSTVSDVVPSSAVTLQSLLVPEQNAEELSRRLKVDHVGLPLETQEVRSKETEDEKLEIFSLSNRISAGVSVCNKLELQMRNSQLLPKGGEKAKAVGNKEAPVATLVSNFAMGKDGNSLPDQSNIEKKTDFSILNVTVVMNQGSPSTITSKTSSHADVKVMDETNSVGEKEKVATVEDKEEQNTTEIVSLMQEQASLCQNPEGNKLIQQVQKKWKCGVKKTPETNLTTSLYAQRHPNSSKNTESKLQGERYCTLDTEANLQLSSMVDSTKQTQQQLARELHALEQQKATEIVDASVPIDIKLSKLASAHREQIRKLQSQQDFELNNLRKQFTYNSVLLQALILQIKQEHQLQRTRLQLMMKQEISSLAKEKQNMTTQITQRFDKKINQQKNIAEQSQQQHLTSNGSGQGPYVSVELFKAPQKRMKRRAVTVHLPAGVAQALLKEDAVYDHFYSGEWN